MSARDKNRADFPESAKFLDDVRAVFGSDVKMIYASEAGNEIGKKGICKFEIDGADFLRIGQLCCENYDLVGTKKGKRNE